MFLIHHRGSGWPRTEIPDGGLALRRGEGGEVEIASSASCRAEVYLVPFADNEVRHAALVVAQGVRDLYVGGIRPPDVSVLDERAEIVLGGKRLYFTGREPLTVGRYQGDAACGVCGEPARGGLAIECSNCAAVTHEGALADGDERLCFSHRGACPGCQLRREDFDWTPEGGPDA